MIDVMLGIQKHNNVNRIDIKWINEIIVVGKMVISKHKYGSYKFPIELLKNELRLRKLNER